MIIVGLLLAVAIFIWYISTTESRFWSSACTEHTVESYQNYINEYPEGEFISLARYGIEDVYWKKCNQSRLEGDVVYYLDYYQAGRYVKEAEELKELIIYRDAMKRNTLDAYMHYLIPYGDGRGYGPIPVGSLLPNEFGLYDMLGNVREEWQLMNGKRKDRNGKVLGVDLVLIR